ncbi:ATP synthase I [Streptomyces albus subsp. albus]|nr:ATP synthase I [Streptomyces albus subsp. albus]
MQSNDARTLMHCAVPTAAVGIVAVAVSSVLAGGKGALGAAFGAILVTAVMALDLLVLQITAKRFPQLFQMMGLALYVVQFLLIAVVLAVFKDTSLFNLRAFAFSLLAATLVWIAAQTRAHMTAKTLYVEPEAEDERKPEGAKSAAPAGSPS